MRFQFVFNLMSIPLSDFDYVLPPDRIAQTPVEPRDAARLLVLPRSPGEMAHHRFAELPHLLSPRDLLVLNDTRVIPAELTGVKRETGGKVHLLLLRQLAHGGWEALVKPARRLPVGTEIEIDGLGCGVDAKQSPASPLIARVEEVLSERTRRIALLPSTEASAPQDFFSLLEQVGQVPLPPYIHAQSSNQFKERYQTIYAEQNGAVAAPTAGMHFTESVFAGLAARGIDWTFVTLHTGLATFQPVEVDHVEDHPMGKEVYSVQPAHWKKIVSAKQAGGRIVAVGTTTVRVLETLAQRGLHREMPATALQGETDLFIYPGYSFQLVDALITNFHLPCSTLLMMVSAFCGTARIQAAYQMAIQEGYRFFSFGDAMLIT